MRCWIKPCPRCRAACLLEREDSSGPRTSCAVCGYVLTTAERKVLIKGMLPEKQGGIARTPA